MNFKQLITNVSILFGKNIKLLLKNIINNYYNRRKKKVPPQLIWIRHLKIICNSIKIRKECRLKVDAQVMLNLIYQLQIYMKFMLIKACGKSYQQLFFHQKAMTVSNSSNKLNISVLDKDQNTIMAINIWKARIFQP